MREDAESLVQSPPTQTSVPAETFLRTFHAEPAYTKQFSVPTVRRRFWQCWQ